jgi:mono/diheme cytochrome c family protein
LNPLLARAAGLATACLLAACGGPHGDGQPLQSTPEQIARGKYLAMAADCAACHTAPGGAAMAGGAPLDSPFGVLYGSNITPHPEHGIGRWSADDFYKAMHDGSSPGGRQLYPAMPYTSYRAIPREDVDALFAYLMQLPPVAQPSKQADLKFPYNLRLGVLFWKLLFLEDELPVAAAGQSADWKRGRYIADVLGHCGECHTPRGRMGQMKRDEPWRGMQIGRWLAPDITRQGLVSRGWTEPDLAAFMKTGIAPPGSAYAEMHLVISLSTQHLSDADMRAMLRFIAGDEGLPTPRAVAIDNGVAQRLNAAHQTYLNVCAGCHGREGEGRAHVAVAMAGNSTLRLTDPRNLVVSVLDGLPAQEFPGMERMQDMPGFATTLSDAEIADLSNYLRARFGGQSADLQAATIARLRHD